MTQARPTMHSMPMSQPGLPGNTSRPQPMQYMQHVAPAAQMSSAPMMQPQPGQPAQHLAPAGQMNAMPMMQPGQGGQHAAPAAQMGGPQMMQPQPGQAAQQNHMVTAHHIISQYQATNPHAQHALGARAALQVPQQAAPGALPPGGQPRPRPGTGELLLLCCACVFTPAAARACDKAP